MDNFKTFLEDLASGRPAKKPVSSNLLKQRAKANKKAMDTGFMKMPDYARKKFDEENINELDKMTMANYKIKAEKDIKKQRDLYFKPGTDPSRKDARRKSENRIKGIRLANKKIVREEKNCGCGQDPCITYGKGKKTMKEEEIKPHWMYKGDKKVWAKNKKDHDRLNKQGYDHDDPKTKKVEESTRDKYNPVISDKRNKEKMAKVGLPAGKGPLVGEATYHYDEENIFEISDALKKRYMAKAGKQVTDTEKFRDYQNRSMDKMGMSKDDKNFVNKKMDKDTLKRRQGMRMARSKMAGGTGGRPRPNLVNSVEFLDLDTVLVEKSTPTNPGLWSKAKAAARSKFDVYPSAYANGWAVQWYKKRGGGWKKGVKEEINLAELSPATIKSYQKKAGQQYRDLKKTTPSRSYASGGYHKGYISGKQYDDIESDREKMQKRGKGLAMSKGKGVKENYEKGRGPTGIAFAIQKGHPDAENPKTRKKYPERQTPEYKANWNKKNKSSMTNPPVRSEGAMKRLATDEAERKRLSAKKSMEKRVPRRMYDKPAYERNPNHYREHQDQLVTNLNLDEAVAAMVGRGLKRVKDTLQQAGQQYKDHQAKQMKAGKGIYQNPVSGENIARRRAQMQKKRLMK